MSVQTQDEQAQLLYKHASKITAHVHANNVSPMNVRHAVILFAHANWDKLEPLYIAQMRYAQAEAVDVQQMWRDMIQKSVRPPMKK